MAERRAAPLLVASALALSSAEARAGDPIFLREGQHLKLQAVAPDTRWYMLTPVAGDYQNQLPCPKKGDCAVPLRYTWVELPALRGQMEIEVSTVPELATPGTHRVRPSAVELPPDALPEDLWSAVELVVRTDDTYVGYASELIGVPFVLNPTLTPEGKHQTDARLGADCVALVIYGQRRLGRDVPYVAPSALEPFTEPVVGPMMAGDVLHFGFQTAVLAEDRGTPGILDAPDLVLQTWHGLAEVKAFGELAYKDSPVRILRWKPVAAQVPTPAPTTP